MLILKLYFLISMKLDVTTVRTNNIVCDLLCNENVHTVTEYTVLITYMLSNR
jgi:hypothetical protein